MLIVAGTNCSVDYGIKIAIKCEQYNVKIQPRIGLDPATPGCE